MQEAFAKLQFVAKAGKIDREWGRLGGQKRIFSRIYRVVDITMLIRFDSPNPSNPQSILYLHRAILCFHAVSSFDRVAVCGSNLHVPISSPLDSKNLSRTRSQFYPPLCRNSLKATEAEGRD